MRLLSWNCQGLGNPCTVRELLLLIKEQEPSVLFLSETRLDSIGVERLRVKIKFDSAFCVPRNKDTGGGLAVLWRAKMDVKLNTFSRNHIDVDVVSMETSKGFRLTGFYGNAETYKRKESWALLKHLSQLSSSPWLCMGDFNEILDNSERKGRGYRPEWQIRDFREAVVYCGLHDLGYVGNTFTWRNNRDANAFVTARLDRMMASSSWIEEFVGAVVTHLAVQKSDHCPLILDIPDGLRVQRRKKIFRFEAMWVKDEQCRGVVEQAWGDVVGEGSLMFQVVEKLKGCRAALIGWSKERFGSLASTIKGKRAQLQQLVNDTPSGHSAGIMALQDELNGLLEKEEIFWRQRSRVAWMSEGDKNTKFFHAQCNQRRQTNLISGLRDRDGVWQTEKAKLAEIVVDYYQAIFTSSNPSVESINTCLQGMESVVTNDMNAHLQAEFNSDEVYQALKQMYPTKAPGPDGMSAIFYQTYWDIVGPEVIQAILSILHSGYMLRKINYTHITLIPKVKNPENITDFRPISLCNVIYKIVSKVLANRMKKVLPFIISEAQSAFVPGRLITDNVLVAFEVMHSMSLKRKGKQGQMALKLDMSKAYDRVEWDFLESIMRRMGFAGEWVQLMMMCLRSVSYSVLINGEQCGYFTASRGIRQGDSLSPYLFLLCAEGLSFLLRKAMVEKKIKGVAASRRGLIRRRRRIGSDGTSFVCPRHLVDWGSEI
jgi:exonuclease III